MEEFSKLIGMSDIHIAPVTQNDMGGYTTGKPVYLAPALSGKVTPKETTVKFSGDDKTQQIITSFSEAQVEIKTATLPLDKIALLYGQTLTKDGILVDGADDKAPMVAVGFRNKLSTNRYQFTWLYLCQFAGEASQYETDGDKMKGQDITIKGTAIARLKDNKWRVRATEETMELAGLTTPQSILDSWFTDVVEPTGAGVLPVQ